jgi:hypothetical protein
MKPLQIVPTSTPFLLGRLAARWQQAHEARTPMGGRIIRLGGAAAAPLWALALLATTPMLLVGMATMV